MTREGQSPTFYQTLTSAIRDVSLHGYDSAARIQMWIQRLKEAAERDLTPVWRMEQLLRSALGAIYRRLVERGGIMRYHRGVALFTVQSLTHAMRVELDKRILASANLIKLNREQAIANTLRRFQGWSSSVPPGGSAEPGRAETTRTVRKSLAELPFQDRRVLIDQGHKLSASISAVVANGGGAIAARWNSNWRQTNYDYREDHKDRDGKVYIIRGSWAQQRGLIKPSTAGYSDEITQPAEEPFCRCYFTYLYALRDLPEDMVTEKGRQELKDINAQR